LFFFWSGKKFGAGGGAENFSLYILEYCEAEKCLAREDFYLEALDPEYNILQKAGSRLGSPDSDVSRAKMKGILKPKSDQHKAALSAAMKGKNIFSSSFFGKINSEETRAKMSIAHPKSFFKE
jgi:group I intron endonuclease